MTSAGSGKRIDSASRVIKASPQTIYRALLDPRSIEQWRAPQGMTCEVSEFEPREGGRFRMTLSYDNAGDTAPGKTSEHRDVVHGRFVTLVPDERVVELITFQSDDPAFAGAMTITTTLVVAGDGTRVTIACENVPPGISPSDHQMGLTSTLANLAAFIQR